MNEIGNFGFKSGFLIVKRFEVLYKIHAEKNDFHKQIYSVPCLDKSPNEYKIKYRGLDRDALESYDKSDLLAEIRIHELEAENKGSDGFIFSFSDSIEVFNFLDEIKENYEIIWTRLVGSNDNIPDNYHHIGFEASNFTFDHFSPSSDCMLFPRWHGTDLEGVLFSKYFSKLNRFGLFNSITDVNEFVKYYLSFDWTEHDEYFICEVFISDLKH